MPMSMNLNVYKILVKPKVRYGSGIWTLGQKRIKMAEMVTFRSLVAYARLDKRNAILKYVTSLMSKHS
jgi:hypothetical protein